MSFTFLASPYTDPDPYIRQRRATHARRAAAWLIEQGETVFSPIAAFHTLASVHKLPTDAGFWRVHNENMLSLASKLVVLCDEGWRESKGIAQEIAFAEAHNIPVEYIEFHRPAAGYRRNGSPF
jgi:Domain of unknown function (DUF1937)